MELAHFPVRFPHVVWLGVLVVMECDGVLTSPNIHHGGRGREEGGVLGEITNSQRRRHYYQFERGALLATQGHHTRQHANKDVGVYTPFVRLIYHYHTVVREEKV